MLVLRQFCQEGVPVAELVLPFELRTKRRLLTQTAEGEEVGVLLPSDSRSLREGDYLLADDGRCVAIRAADEKLLQVRCADAASLAKAAYHLGNRHVKVQVGQGWLRLAEDDVLAEMLCQMGLVVERIIAPFEPEQGAYGGGHHHSHGQESAFHYAPKLHLFGRHHDAA